MIVRNARDLGLLIRKHRVEQSLTQDDLADLIGSTRYWIIDIEKGKPTAQIGLVLRVLTALGLHVDIGIGQDEFGDGPSRSNRADQCTVDLDRVLSGSTGSNLALGDQATGRPTTDRESGGTPPGRRRAEDD